MATEGVLTESRYAKLVSDIRKLLEEGKGRAQRMVAQELVNTYWAIGKRLTEEDLTGRAHYGESILEDLSDELGIELRTLQHAIVFFQIYNTTPRVRNLTWSHYRELIRIKDDKARGFYEQEAQRLEWTRDQLVRAIQSEAHEQTTEDGKAKKPRKNLTRPIAATYVYKAEADRVIDGDTLILRIDLGFQVWKEQRIRLADIDTPPVDEPKGQEAFRYVRDQLAKAETVVVKTHKIDIYGRYVGHVFYELKDTDLVDVFEKGRYLNQELVEQGLATTV